MKIVARIFQNVPITLSQMIHLDDEASHYLTRVLRVKCGDYLTLFNGEGGEFEAIIKHIDKRGVDVFPLSYSKESVESPIEIHLAQGIARGDKMDFIIQKAVELGVNQIIPLTTERSNVKLDPARENARVKHWQAVAVSASQQSGRNRIPKLLSPLSLKDWLQSIKEDQKSRRYILLPELSPDENKHGLDEMREGKGEHKHQVITILIGGEGGFSKQEIRAAYAHQFTPLNLGPRVLRTETASIACIAILQYCFGDMSTFLSVDR